jgi:hypothetical protein
MILRHNFTSRPLRLRRWRRFARTAQPRNALFGPGDGRIDLGVVPGFRPLRGTPGRVDDRPYQDKPIGVRAAQRSRNVVGDRRRNGDRGRSARLRRTILETPRFSPMHGAGR